VFYNFLGAYTLLSTLPMLFGWLPSGWVSGLVVFSGWGAVLSGLAALYFMHSIYRIEARPFWNHWQVLTSFYGNMLVLGPLPVILAFAGVQLYSGLPWSTAAAQLAGIMLLGVLMESIGLYRQAQDLQAGSGEAQASHYEQTTTFGNTYLARNAGLGLAMATLLALSVTAPEGLPGLLLWLAAAGIIVVTAITGRALFYALVIPTTMPGAFFWRNKGFEEHARETGLADMPQVGVLPDCH
jgi:DMSO reductase anchor subunit